MLYSENNCSLEPDMAGLQGADFHVLDLFKGIYCFENLLIALVLCSEQVRVRVFNTFL